ncbi:MAG: hypothetical protein WEC84_01385 [Candidatus Andersenbacteria bacterium]
MPRILFTSLFNQRQWLFWLLLIVLLIPFWPILLGKFYAIGDMRDVYIPLELFYQQESRAGHIPAWNPDVAWGYPVLAGGQIGFYYPPLLLGRLLLPISIYLPVIVIAHVIALGAGMFFLLRKVFALPPLAAAFGTIAFALSASVWQHTTHLNIFLAVTWLPWQIVVMHMLATKKKLVSRDLILPIIVLALPVLIGQFQIPILIAALSSIYFIYQKFTASTGISGIRTVALIGVGAVLLTAAQLLPTAELFQFSSRNSSQGFNIERANQYSYPIYHLPAVVFPRFYGNDDSYWGRRLEIEQGFYIGVIPLLIAIWALWKTRRDATYRFWRYVVIISFLLALGSLSPFRLIGIEPSLWVFSAPSRWLIFTSLALSIFAAVGFSKNLKELRTFLVWAAASIGIVVVIYNIALYVLSIKPEGIFTVLQQLLPSSIFAEQSSYYVEKIAGLVSSAQASSASFASPYTWLALIPLVAAPFLVRHKQALLVISVIELTIIAATTTPTQAWNTILEPPATVQALPASIQTQQARIYSIREGGDTGAIFTDSDSRADRQARELQRQLLVPMAHTQFGISGIEWPASLDIQAHEVALAQLRGEAGYSIADTTLAEELNIGAVLVPIAIDEMTTDPQHTVNGVAIHELQSRPRAIAEDGSAVKYIPVAPDHVRLQGDSQNGTAVIVKDTWYPGWVARVNQETIPILPGERFFRSIQLPAGQTTVEMTYRPLSVYAGLVASLATLTLLVFLLIPKRKT